MIFWFVFRILYLGFFKLWVVVVSWLRKNFVAESWETETQTLVNLILALRSSIPSQGLWWLRWPAAETEDAGALAVSETGEAETIHWSTPGVWQQWRRKLLDVIFSPGQRQHSFKTLGCWSNHPSLILDKFFTNEILMSFITLILLIYKKKKF